MKDVNLFFNPLDILGECWFASSGTLKGVPVLYLKVTAYCGIALTQRFPTFSKWLPQNTILQLSITPLNK